MKLHGLPTPTATAALRATEARRTTAYKVKAAVEATMPNLLNPPGRPPPPLPMVRVDERVALAHKVRDFVYDHPGCVSGSSLRRRYSDAYRLFVLELWENPDHQVEQIAEATGVPSGTLKDWIHGDRPLVAPPENLTAAPEPSVARIKTVVAEYACWKGGFRNFCEHVQFHLRIPFGRQYISDILQAHGLRTPIRRGRPCDASANRSGFETFFPNAQWVGDGTELVVKIGGQTFKVNLELLVDADTTAFMGASMRPTEDAAAVIEAFEDGVNTAGPPLALLLDNKPSNHTQEIDEALGDTLRMRSRPYEPTDKPQVEGAFGLFKQEAPPLVLHGDTTQQIASEVARLVITTWARAVNHRARNDRAGNSRVQLFQSAKPTEAEVQAAKVALQRRHQRQKKAKETRARRQHPITRAALDAAFKRLNLHDPERHIRIAIASWPMDAVLEGIAVFEGKKRAGTLPESVDGRYLRGIVKNIAEEREGWEIAVALLRERLVARDLMLTHLDVQRDAQEEDTDDTKELIKNYITKAMGACRRIDRTFWLLATVDTISDEPSCDHHNLLRLAARRIHATYHVPHKDRLAATRLLFAKVLPID
ncbi:MAG: transposase family protein [Gammaproteobacteria bacterium]|nr:transposase family protein [Gammaproteobacteria bacterium]